GPAQHLAARGATGGGRRVVERIAIVRVEDEVYDAARSANRVVDAGIREERARPRAGREEGQLGRLVDVEGDDLVAQRPFLVSDVQTGTGGWRAAVESQIGAAHDLRAAAD